MHDPGADVAPALKDGRYRLVEVLGQGGMATVYRAWDSRLEVERAIKILLPEMAARPRIRERFHAEARTMARLSHPHIVAVQDVDAEGDRVFLVMELLRGGTLWGLVERLGPLPARMAVDAVLPVLSALAAAHGARVVHRDIKPQNVILSEEGVPKLTDFGIARLETESRTRTAAVMGTWTYMPPEQRTSAKDSDARTDLYAVGAMLWALCTAQDPPDLFAADLDPSLLAGLPPALAEVVRTATRYQRDQRFADARAMAAALVACREALPAVPAALACQGPVQLPTASPGSRGATTEPPTESSPRPPAAQGLALETVPPAEALPPPPPASRAPAPVAPAGTAVPGFTLPPVDLTLSTEAAPPEPRPAPARRLPLVLGAGALLAAAGLLGLWLWPEPELAVPAPVASVEPGLEIDAPTPAALADPSPGVAAAAPPQEAPSGGTPGVTPPRPAPTTATSAPVPVSEAPEIVVEVMPEEGPRAAEIVLAEASPAAEVPVPEGAPEAGSPAPPASSARGKVSVQGLVDEVLLVHALTGARERPGQVPVGDYTVFVRFIGDAELTQVSRISVRDTPGWESIIRCKPLKRTCY